MKYVYGLAVVARIGVTGWGVSMLVNYLLRGYGVQPVSVAWGIIATLLAVMLIETNQEHKETRYIDYSAAAYAEWLGIMVVGMIVVCGWFTSMFL